MIYRKILLITLLIIYRVLLDYSYYSFVAPYYSYMGFEYEFVLETYLLSWFLYLAVIPTVKIYFKRYIDFIILIYIIFLMAPLFSLFGLSNSSFIPPILCFISFFIIYLVGNTKTYLAINITPVKSGNLIAKIASLGFVLFLILWFIKTGAIHNYTFDLTNVYDVRYKNRELASGGIFTYINMWVMKIFMTYLFVINIEKKHFLNLILLFLIQLFFFSVSGHKSVLFFPLIVIGIWLLINYDLNRSSIVTFLAIVIVLVPYLYYLYTDDIFIPSMFIRRMLFLPAELSFVYYDFFQANDFLIWSNSVLEFIFDYPYELPIPLVIGYEYGFDANVNNGFISMGYAHLGVIGVLIYAVIIGIIIRYLDSIVDKGVPFWIVLSLTVIPVRAMIIQSDLFTQVLTGGLVVAIILLYLMSNKYYKKQNENIAYIYRT